MIRSTSYTNPRRFFQRLRVVKNSGRLEHWEKTQVDGKILYTLVFYID